MLSTARCTSITNFFEFFKCEEAKPSRLFHPPVPSLDDRNNKDLATGRSNQAKHSEVSDVFGSVGLFAGQCNGQNIRYGQCCCLRICSKGGGGEWHPIEAAGVCRSRHL